MLRGGREKLQAEGENEKRGRMVVTVRIISNVSSHSHISVGAITFRNIGKSGPVNPELASDMAQAWPAEDRKIV